MKIIVAAFYADIPGRPSRFDEFLTLVLASRRALALTNPRARYVVLTDPPTGELFDRAGVANLPIAETALPLMLKIIDAQRRFVRQTAADLIVLPDIDCLANRALADAIPATVGLAVTHKGPKFRRKINNLAYVRDRELGARFLDRAFAVLEGWPVDTQEWGGDQEAWGAVLGEPRDWRPLGGECFVTPSAPHIHLYPCATHNKPLADSGEIHARRHAVAYFIHLKGPRKQHLAKFMAARFGGGGATDGA